MNVRLQGNKVVLRDMQPSDLERMWYWNFAAEDREHHNWNGPYFPREYMTMEQYVEQSQSDLAESGTKLPRTKLVIEIDGELRGAVSRYWVSEETNWLEIGIVIFDSRYWSGGYGTEAFRMWIDYLFANLEVVRLGIATWSGNERMIRLAGRLGMVEEARVRKARIVGGQFYDAVKMGMLREEWELQRTGLPLGKTE